MKTLAICIPTYRRPELLRRCILSAIAAAETCPIEIVVADDSLSDANAAVLRELTQAYPFVRWYRNQKNLGIDLNIQHAVDLCESDFAWMIGEDDVFLAGVVARMHTRIQSSDAPFICANYQYVGDDPEHGLGTAVEASFKASIDRDIFIAEHLWVAGFIGACVVQKRNWVTTDPAPYAGSYFMHVGRIAEMLALADTVSVVAEPCVANRVQGRDTFTWKKDSYGVYFGFVQMCGQVGVRAPVLAPVMQQAASSFERRYRWLSLRLAMRLRSERGFDSAQFARYFRPGVVADRKRLMFFLISLMPPAVFVPLVWLYRVVRQR